jgi:hypothetical protein
MRNCIRMPVDGRSMDLDPSDKNVMDCKCATELGGRPGERE